MISLVMEGTNGCGIVGRGGAIGDLRVYFGFRLPCYGFLFTTKRFSEENLMRSKNKNILIIRTFPEMVSKMRSSLLTNFVYDVFSLIILSYVVEVCSRKFDGVA